MISRLANAEDWHSLVHSGHTLDQAIRRLYVRRYGVIGCCAATATSLLIGSGEIWIALHALGLRATLVNAVILQSMVLAIRAAVFPVPGALGVQEGGYVVVGNLLGIPGDAAFALSLIARVRELILGVPGLIAWQVIEARRVLRTRLASNEQQWLWIYDTYREWHFRSDSVRSSSAIDKSTDDRTPRTVNCDG